MKGSLEWAMKLSSGQTYWRTARSQQQVLLRPLDLISSSVPVAWQPASLPDSRLPFATRSKIRSWPPRVRVRWVPWTALQETSLISSFSTATYKGMLEEELHSTGSMFPCKRYSSWPRREGSASSCVQMLSTSSTTQTSRDLTATTH